MTKSSTKHHTSQKDDRGSSPSRVLYGQLALGMVIFGSGTPISKILTGAFPVFIASELRVLISTLILLPFILPERETLKQYQRKDWIVILLIAVVGMFLFSVLMLYSMKQVSSVVGSIVMSTTPVVTALGSFLFFRDRLGWHKSAAIALAYILLGEPFRWIHLAGFAAVFAGVLLISREHAHMHAHY